MKIDQTVIARQLSALDHIGACASAYRQSLLATASILGQTNDGTVTAHALPMVNRHFNGLYHQAETGRMPQPLLSALASASAHTSAAITHRTRNPSRAQYHVDRAAAAARRACEAAASHGARYAARIHSAA